MKIYLAGYISGKKIEECMAWRRKIAEHYNHWKKKSNVSITDVGVYEEEKYEKYPITWLDPLNGKNFGTITQDGLKCEIPPKMILAGDIMSVEACDLLIANMDKFGETRDMTGTTCEVAIAGYLGKPVIMITKEDIYRYHPFLSSFATVIVETVDELLDKKYINYFYKRINDAIY